MFEYRINATYFDAEVVSISISIVFSPLHSQSVRPNALQERLGDRVLHYPPSLRSPLHSRSPHPARDSEIKDSLKNSHENSKWKTGDCVISNSALHNTFTSPASSSSANVTSKRPNIAARCKAVRPCTTRLANLRLHQRMTHKKTSGVENWMHPQIIFKKLLRWYCHYHKFFSLLIVIAYRYFSLHQWFSLIIMLLSRASSLVTREFLPRRGNVLILDAVAPVTDNSGEKTGVKLDTVGEGLEATRVTFCNFWWYSLYQNKTLQNHIVCQQKIQNAGIDRKENPQQIHLRKYGRKVSPNIHYGNFRAILIKTIGPTPSILHTWRIGRFSGLQWV